MELIQKAFHLANAIQVSASMTDKIQGRSGEINNSIQIGWMSPIAGAVALNCDGSVSNASLLASCVGVVRDDSGHFIFGFSVNLGSCTILAAELWGIFHGLKIAWSRGFMNIVVQSDSKNAINLLTNGCRTYHSCYVQLLLFNKCIRMMGLFNGSMFCGKPTKLLMPQLSLV